MKQKNQGLWTIKSFVIMLVVTFIAVPVFIEGALQQALQSLFKSELYAGTAAGFVMAAVFLSALYWLMVQAGDRKIGFHSFSKRHWPLILFWLLVLILGSVAIVVLMEWFGMTYENKKTASLQHDLSLFSFILAFVSAAVISPFYEEIIYRGFFYPWLKRKGGIVFGLVGSSFIFMLVHLPTYNTLPVNFLSGLVFAWVYEKTKSLLPSMIIHACFNAIAVILTAAA
ncbi:CPBP family intramembrane glutamic endopeptidase [Priestia megaterium]|uniref:CPBP family intramembrane glutamic endopeptidase n=1 Tax=Priestia megaterium TaxID=1404 RepID=UPI0013E2CBF7|nr:CPBP family intramembrane glutamic endopeptidase [Priestia megaterium]MED3863025.1 CPBP family intramembrane metalloprotease [Priestia megaterium]MED4099446.1 CPBP family intramembrane metalloprotease [Priestia megaterium]MED4143982.1 CPBP family intramembrane metalloprotease [Priestia megaterium]MED4166766.1 CPBP family intramembrane metalloprotease [Priestia megaterium]MED4197064.1 CPBP family intramembrane metalloprotease [Priestia megaterium]